MREKGRDPATLRYVIGSLRREAAPLRKHSDPGLKSQGYALNESARRFGWLLARLEPKKRTKPRKSRP